MKVVGYECISAIQRALSATEVARLHLDGVPDDLAGDLRDALDGSLTILRATMKCARDAAKAVGPEHVHG